MNIKGTSFFTLSLILGILIIIQIRSITAIDSIFLRETEVNFYEELLLFKSANKDLSDQVEKLEENLEQLSDQNLAISVIESEINQYKKLTGDYPIFGQGVSININGDISVHWLIDLSNELKNAGAEAISINNIRLSESIGLNVIPNGQIMLGSEFISTPFTIKAISNSNETEKYLNESGGIISRFKTNNPDISISIEAKDVISM